MEEEGSWPRLGLLLLSGTAVGWLVLCLFVLPFLTLSYITCLCRRGFLGGFIDQPTQGYNGNMPSRWVRIVGVRSTGMGRACGLVVRRVPLGAGLASVVMAWPS